MKIPTLLALTLLSVAIVLGLVIYFYNDRQLEQYEKELDIKKVQVVNISDTQAAISWQTSGALESIIVYGINNLSLTSTADGKKHTTHLVTLDNLIPDTKYQFRIKIGDTIYPNKSYGFKTGIRLEASKNLNPPIRGSVLNSSFEPVNEALVILKLTGASDLATVTSDSGNFILPLINLRKNDSLTFFDLRQKQDAILLILSSKEQTQVSLSLPIDKILPPIITGQNIDLKAYLASSTREEVVLPLKDTVVEKGSPLSRFDLNKDSKINAVDLSIIIDNFGKDPKDQDLLKKYQNIDFNNDNKINQADIDLLKRSLL